MFRRSLVFAALLLTAAPGAGAAPRLPPARPAALRATGPIGLRPTAVSAARLAAPALPALALSSARNFLREQARLSWQPPKDLAAGPRIDAFDLPAAKAYFDGARLLRDQYGATFAPIPNDNGSLRLHRFELAPAATRREAPGTEGLSGRELFDRLAYLLARSHQPPQGDDQKVWGAASNYLFAIADNVIIGGVRGVVDAYSGVFVPGTSTEGRDYPEPGDRNQDGHRDRGMNVEHVWPQALFRKKLPMRADLHHLMATFIHPNEIRGILPFGKAREPIEYRNSGGAKRGGGFFEPPDAVKGRVARAPLYFYVRYKNSGVIQARSTRFFEEQLETLLRWNQEYLPDLFEQRRNDLVQSFQGNRNLFVDDPALADRIGIDGFRAARIVPQ